MTNGVLDGGIAGGRTDIARHMGEKLRRVSRGRSGSYSHNVRPAGTGGLADDLQVQLQGQLSQSVLGGHDLVRRDERDLVPRTLQYHRIRHASLDRAAARRTYRNDRTGDL